MKPNPKDDALRAGETAPREDLRPWSTEPRKKYIIVAAGPRDMPLSQRLVNIDKEVIVGREPKEAPHALRIDDDGTSRAHAAFAVGSDGNVRVRDLGSRNGTIVAGSRIDSEVPLAEGVPVFIGDSVLVVRSLTGPEVEAIREDCASPLGPVSTLSGSMALGCRRLRRLAERGIDLLLSGETGSGKEVYAEAIHKVSARRGPFVAVNCAALPESLAESELFGNVKGAHSTASQARRGWLEQAEGGTLFLDEIGDMPGPVQAKLLRFLQDRTFAPLGSSKTQKLDVRVVAATRRGLSDDDNYAGVRPDLAARLGPHPIVLPPLRDRIEDLGNLAEFLANRLGARIHATAFYQLFLHSWPGNVRELAKALQWATALADPEGIVRAEHLPDLLVSHVGATDAVSPISSTPPQAPRARVRRTDVPSREELQRLVHKYEGRVGDVATELQRQRTLVWRWLKAAGIDPTKSRT